MNMLKVEGNLVWLVYNPIRESVNVGDNIEIWDSRENRGVLAQVIEIEVPELPGIFLEIIRREVVSTNTAMHGIEDIGEYKRAVEGMKVAIARVMMEIRRENERVTYEQWRGYVPSRNAQFQPANLSNVIRNLRMNRMDVG
jgi:hypothetical protein